MKKKVKFAFVILVYINTDDVVGLLKSIRAFADNSAVVIVNSYYDDASKKEFEKIASDNQCDFINVENKGYSYGNNRGIEYCHNYYDYEYIVISNPDIVVEKFDSELLKGGDIPAVYAPVIRTLTGKMQNPFGAVKNNFSEAAIYKGMKSNIRLLITCGVAVNKVVRVAFNAFVFGKKAADIRQIYAAHGSFFMLSRKAVEMLGNVFDENMFLFGEETCLAYRLDVLGIPVYMTKDIEVLHKEDGSVRLADINQYEIVRHSMIYYYENYRSQNKKGQGDNVFWK